MKRRNYLLFFVSLILILFSLNIVLATNTFFFDRIYYEINNDDIDEELVINECDYDNVIDSSKCINMFIRVIYNYNIEGLSNEKSLQNLNKYGGNCLDYTIVYENILEKIGFNKTRIYEQKGLNETENEIIIKSHSYLIGYDKDSYCKLDQTKIKCSNDLDEVDLK